MIFEIRQELPSLAVGGLGHWVPSTNREWAGVCGRGSRWRAAQRVSCLPQTHGRVPRYIGRLNRTDFSASRNEFSPPQSCSGSRMHRSVFFPTSQPDLWDWVWVSQTLWLVSQPDPSICPMGWHVPERARTPGGGETKDRAPLMLLERKGLMGRAPGWLSQTSAQVAILWSGFGGRSPAPG